MLLEASYSDGKYFFFLRKENVFYIFTMYISITFSIYRHEVVIYVLARILPRLYMSTYFLYPKIEAQRLHSFICGCKKLKCLFFFFMYN